MSKRLDCEDPKLFWAREDAEAVASALQSDEKEWEFRVEIYKEGLFVVACYDDFFGGLFLGFWHG